MALLHIQPPAFNLFVGIVERWSPLSAAFTYQVLYLACGLVLLLTLRALLVELGCSELAATVGTVVVALDPVLLSYENTATYELPVATLLVVSGWCCARYARTRSTGHLVGFVAAITAAALTRALLHPLWLDRGRRVRGRRRCAPAPAGARSARPSRSRSCSSAAGW